MVYGMSMLYGLCGTLELAPIATVVATQGVTVPLVVGVAGLLVGLGFKISAVPLHFWCPDVFEGAGIDVAAFLSVASKGAGLALLLRIVMSLAQASGFQGDLLMGLSIAIGILGAVTATVGNAGALVQNNIKRLLAYSSIAHAGYMLCAISILVKPWAAGNFPSAADINQAILLYLAVYLFMNLGAFTVAGLVRQSTGSEDIAAYAGLGRRNTLLAIAMGVCLVSLVGLPPFAGFSAKLWVMKILADAGSWWWILVAVIGLNTVISLYYYARVLRVMFLTESDAPPVAANPIGSFLALSSAGALLAMFVLFYPVLNLTRNHASMNLPEAVVKPPAAQVVQATR